MNRIDVHHHAIPSEYAALLQERGLTPGGIPLPAWSAEQSLEVMARNHIATAILSVSVPGAWFGNIAETRLWARRLNDHSASVVAEHPGRFGFFATLTLPDVDAAIAEADHAFDVLGADGVVLLANEAGTYLGDPAYGRLFDHLDARKAVVFIHPGDLPAAPVPGIPAFAADFLLDTTRAAINLVLSGTMERCPDIKFILAHAGGFLPNISYRVLLTMLQRRSKAQQAKAILLGPDKVLAPLKRFYFDIALSQSPTAFPSLMALAEPGHVLYGSDFPFAPAAAVGFMAETYEAYDFTPEQRTAIDRGSAEALFPRLAATPAPGPAPRKGWWSRR